MVDGVFFIGSALNVKQLSVFNNEERYLQTLDTIESIDKHCPSNMKFMFDTSYAEPNAEYVAKLMNLGVKYYWAGNHADVQRLSDMGQRSLAETIGFIMMLNAFNDYRKTADIKFKRFYKISGRYKLNDNFVPDHEDYKDAYVFLPTVDSWMPKAHQESAGVDRIFELRLWHMDANLLDTFSIEIYNIFDEMRKHNIDVEHAYYKVLSKYNWKTVKPIGLEGVLAPTGVIINE
jgi:hypothetical protein